MAKDTSKDAQPSLEKKLKKCKKINRAKDIGMFSVVVVIVAIWFGTGMISNPQANQEVVDTLK